jgi:bifunctional NMN adenylyltransferase/nudix hydrolase
MSHFGLKTNPNAVSATAVNPALAVVIGRFQVPGPHAGHLVLIRKALSVARNVLILVGSSHQARTIKNPFSYEERREMIVNSLDESERSRVIVWALTDNLYSDDDWMNSIQTYVKQAKSVFNEWSDHGMDGPTILVGNKKDESSYYLDLFPQYQFQSLGEFKLNFDATQIRQILFEDPKQLEVLKSMLPECSYKFLTEKFIGSEEHKRLIREYNKVRQYQEDWSKSPHDNFFTTVDAVVKKAGHILLVQRDDAPGEGLWALPGGFVKLLERLITAMLRELDEETHIDLPPAILQSAVRRNQGSDHRVFDHPDRDLRGRVITHAYLLDLDAADKKYGLPKVRGDDDAREAKWFEISTVVNEMREQIYGDHLSIIRAMLGI